VGPTVCTSSGKSDPSPRHEDGFPILGLPLGLEFHRRLGRELAQDNGKVQLQSCCYYPQLIDDFQIQTAINPNDTRKDEIVCFGNITVIVDVVRKVLRACHQRHHRIPGNCVPHGAEAERKGNVEEPRHDFAQWQSQLMMTR